MILPLKYVLRALLVPLFNEQKHTPFAQSQGTCEHKFFEKPLMNKPLLIDACNLS